jgi:glycosyltransferase involved in cell wall biosynthesis
MCAATIELGQAEVDRQEASAVPRVELPDGQRAPVTAVILTCNEEQNLAPCIESLRGWVERIVVVDSGSTDATIEIARSFGAHVLEHRFETHTRQWKWALENVPETTAEWILGLDADQRTTPELASEIQTRLRSGVGDVQGFYVRRRQVFRGRWIRHGGYYPKHLLKLFRRNCVYFDDAELVDHHFYVPGPTEQLCHDIIEDNAKENDLAFWIEKHCRYAALMAQEEHRRRNGRAESGSGRTLQPALIGSPDERSLWFKRLWNRLPLYLRPWLYFVYRYVFRLGFLDGRQGLIFHFLQACWFRFMVDIYLDELRQRKS